MRVRVRFRVRVGQGGVAMPRVAHASGRGRRVRRACHAWHVRQARGRSVRRACHAWHVGQAGGKACGRHATCGTCVRQGAERAAGMPRVARASGKGAARAAKGHAWHLRRAGGRRVRRSCHAWHMQRAGGRAAGVRPRVVTEPGRGRGVETGQLMDVPASSLDRGGFVSPEGVRSLSIRQRPGHLARTHELVE